MLNVLIHGMGAMGQYVYDLLKGQTNIICYDSFNAEYCKKLNEIKEKIDVIVDFSHHSLVDDLIDFAADHSIPVVICTTGLSETTQQNISDRSKKIPIFQSGNMSLGINVLLELAKLGAKSLSNFDIEIIEKHHNKKIDAPSGTAYMIAEVIQSVQTLNLEYNRYGNDAKRGDNVIGMHAIRGGSITGEHTVLFAGLDETIEIKHQATSKKVFAKGAISAAYFLKEQQPGLYTMNDLLKGEIQ